MFLRQQRNVLPLLVCLVAAACAPQDRASHEHPGQGSQRGGTTRFHYISADLVPWDYAPTGRNEITGEPFDDEAAEFVGRGDGRIGSTYLKCLYREYTDASFAERVPADPADGYLGNLGPVIRAEVGDTIKVVFRNKCPFPASMHPHGVQYSKANEGAPYEDGAPAHKADAVPPGGTVTYTWHARPRSGPGPMEGSSVAWMYHSHADEIGDVYAGLSGFLVVTARGEARPDGSPKDVARELFSLFEVDDENSTPLFDANVERFLGGAAPDPDDAEFHESNLMHAINGYVYGNGPVPVLKVGETVRWYVMGMGTEVDLHTPHWHANTVTVNGMRTDVANLLPASMVTADMVPDTPGTWLFHCHVGDHIAAGMQARYRVVR
jgi:hephaestin